ncbi:glyceraldehyde-3-phosphate dehydrogenase [Maritimibacter sp. UBA3975]|nr:glyceraldehyde-3-phosphate dehydrogenase [Maritimibacter sp. UBA3975]MAM61195.1 glyceraldehyde-3-phosphate dehydrogenase [Maritimibacter sp.]|tara:strand:+ start:4280 stop:4423 length:144 start_codon:yes stop_codon:yes gene_type:complete
MTNRLALILFLIIVACIAWDLILNGGRASVFLGKEMFEFLDWIAFWR